MHCKQKLGEIAHLHEKAQLSLHFTDNIFKSIAALTLVQVHTWR